MKILLIAVASLFFYSCAAKEPIIITEYVTVKEPVMCGIMKRERPSKQDSVASTINVILMHTEQLELDIEYCTGGFK